MHSRFQVCLSCLQLLDACPVCDGAAALVLTNNPNLAAQADGALVRIAGSAAATGLCERSQTFLFRQHNLYWCSFRYHSTCESSRPTPPRGCADFSIQGRHYPWKCFSKCDIACVCSRSLRKLGWSGSSLTSLSFMTHTPSWLVWHLR